MENAYKYILDKHQKIWKIINAIDWNTISEGICRCLLHLIYEHVAYFKLCDFRLGVACAYVC